MAFRIWIKRLHLVLAIAAAIPIFVMSVSGTLLVYREPIDEYFSRDYREVPVGPQKLTIQQMKESLEKQLPGKTFLGVVLPPTEGISYYFWMKEAKLWTVAYVDPYTGAFKGIRAWEDWTMANFIWWLTDLHMTFKAGRPGAIAMGLFSLMLCLSALSGIVLWWPRKGTFTRQKFVPKPAKRWKQTAWQMHPVLGFWASVVLMLVTLTGAFISFWEPMTKFVHAVTLSPPPHEHPVAKPIEGKGYLPMEQVLAIGVAELQKRHKATPAPQAVYLPSAENVALEISFQGDPSIAWADHWHVWVHGQTGDVIDVEAPPAHNRAEKVISWIGAIHFGSWGAIWGNVGDQITRITWALAMLVTLFLMASGFAMVKKSVWRKILGWVRIRI